MKLKKKAIQKELQLKKITLIMRFLFLLQSIMMVTAFVISTYGYVVEGRTPSRQSVVAIFVVMLIMLLMTGYFVFRDTNLYNRIDKQMTIKNESYKNIENLNLALRGQRHDFLNHIQILYSLIELEAYDEASDYLNDLYGDVGKLSDNIKTKSVAMNALIQAKSNEAESRGLNFKVSINSRLEQINMPDWELCRVVGNMLDNGMRAAEQINDQGQIEVVIKESIISHDIIIKNSSNPIDEPSIKHFFTPGFTTKKQTENHGMGLYISEKIMKKYGNSIEMSYEEGMVLVTVTMPKSID